MLIKDMKREIKEELNIDIGELRYLGSYPNIYKYEGVTYHTCDLFYYCRIDTLPADFDRTEIMEFVLLSPSEVSDNDIAFESVKIALNIFQLSKSDIDRGTH